MISKILISGSFFGIDEGITSFLLLIDAKIYWAFSQMYSLFINLAQARIFSTDMFEVTIKNIYVVFGVIALFILAFNLLQGMINPENVLKGDSTIKHVIVRLLMAVFLTCMVPTIFNFLYDFQYSLLSTQVIPRALFGETTTETVDVYYKDENGNFFIEPNCAYTSEQINNETDASQLENMLRECGVKTTTEVDSSTKILESYGNGIGYYVLSGFLYPTIGLADVEVNASDYFNVETGFFGGLLGCGLAAAGTAIAAVVTVASAPTTGGTLTGPAAALTAHTGAVAAATCAVAFGTAQVVNKIGETITAKKFLWSQAVDLMMYGGEYDVITAFAPAVTNGDMQYTPIISTIAGIILLYLVFSFCLDLGVRAAKLIMYQILAPISFLMSVLPKNKDLMGKWFKAVLTIWFEVFTRVFCLCTVALLISKLDFEQLNSFGLMARAILVLGLVTFAKQVPKLLGEITGIDTGNIKLGIREKLAEGGAFTAGAILGGGATALARNAVNAGRNIKNNWKDASNGERAKMIFGGIGSTLAGGASGAARSGKAGWGAKSAKDMKGAAVSGAHAAEAKRERRAAYKASHGSFGVETYTKENGETGYRITGVAAGHAADLVRKGKEWAGIGVVSSSEADYFTSGANAFDSAHSQAEAAYKGKPGHNKLKEDATAREMEYQRIFREALGASGMSQGQWENLSNVERQAFIDNDSTLKEAQTKMLAAKSELKIHEATEMGKKISMQMEAINALVNAKMKYYDLSKEIFTDDFFNKTAILKDRSGSTDSAEVMSLINKIKNNQTIDIADLEKIDLSSLEGFLDKAGIEAKNLAAEKRVEVAHANALKQENKPDKK